MVSVVNLVYLTFLLILVLSFSSFSLKSSSGSGISSYNFGGEGGFPKILIKNKDYFNKDENSSKFLVFDKYKNKKIQNLEKHSYNGYGAVEAIRRNDRHFMENEIEDFDGFQTKSFDLEEFPTECVLAGKVLKWTGLMKKLKKLKKIAVIISLALLIFPIGILVLLPFSFIKLFLLISYLKFKKVKKIVKKPILIQQITTITTTLSTTTTTPTTTVPTPTTTEPTRFVTILFDSGNLGPGSYNITNMPGACVDFPQAEFPQPTAHVHSVNTHGLCVIIFAGPGCTGQSFMFQSIEGEQFIPDADITNDTYDRGSIRFC